MLILGLSITEIAGVIGLLLGIWNLVREIKRDSRRRTNTSAEKLTQVTQLTLQVVSIAVQMQEKRREFEETNERYTALLEQTIRRIPDSLVSQKEKGQSLLQSFRGDKKTVAKLADDLEKTSREGLKKEELLVQENPLTVAEMENLVRQRQIEVSEAKEILTTMEKIISKLERKFRDLQKTNTEMDEKGYPPVENTLE